MDNISRTKQQAKEVFLNRQQDEMLALYENADTTERKAIIKNIDSFLEVVPNDAKIFWLKFRRKLEMNNESKILFPLGNVYLTIGAKEALNDSNQQSNEFLARHQSGDYGDICEDDKLENELSLKEGFRILSSYKTSKGIKIWLITEADRNSTTALLPCEY